MKSKTTFIIASIDRLTLQRAIDSVKWQAPVLHEIDKIRTGCPATVRNNLVKQADTEWVSFLDDDDTATPDYVQRLEEEIAAHPEADVIHFRQYHIDTAHILPVWPEVEWGNVGISFAVKTKIASENPFIEEKYEDFCFLKRLQAKGYNIYFSKYIVYHVRH